MKKIMFLYHIKEREYNIIEMIEEEIKSNYPDVIIQSGEFYSSIMDTIQFRPHIIVTIPPRDYHSSNYLTMLKIITGAVVISMNTEGFYKFDPKYVLAQTGFNTYAKELVDYYIMWGSKTKKKLGQRLLIDGKLSDIRRVKVTGYAYYELDKVYKKYNIYIKSFVKWFTQYSQNILILTGFVVADCNLKEYHVLGYFENKKPFNKMSSLEIAQAQESIEAEVEFRRKYIEGIIMLAQSNPQIGFIVKLHPIEIKQKNKIYDSLQNYSNILLIKEQVPVGVLLDKVNGMVHYNSSCNLEAYIYKVPTIQIYSDIITSYRHVWQYKEDSTYFVNINRFNEINKIIKEGLEYKKLEGVEKTLFGLFNWKADKEYHPIEKTAKYIINAHKAQHLKYHDKEVIDAVNSVEGKQTRTMLLNSLWEKLSNNKLMFIEICALIKIIRYIFLNKIVNWCIKK